MIRKILSSIAHIIRFPFDNFRGNEVSFSSRLSRNILIARTKIGRYSYVGCNVVINNAEIGNYCSIAPGVQIGGMEHSHWWLCMSTFLSDRCSYNKRVKIGNDVWIAAGAIVKQGVTIGSGSVIGALAFVNTDIPENTIAIGTPAKFYRYRMDPEKFEKLKQTNYWSLDKYHAKRVLSKFDAENPG